MNRMSCLLAPGSRRQHQRIAQTQGPQCGCLQECEWGCEACGPKAILVHRGSSRCGTELRMKREAGPGAGGPHL
ncbi:rCG34063 [Rattus norvegicus]|uniref:RCG34063 n=1 Tax=Rattus norvegicus TaxID=10116 RepID=A6HEP6_RAT|nr:rCG34063 [Rattus norvegicus]